MREIKYENISLKFRLKLLLSGKLYFQLVKFMGDDRNHLVISTSEKEIRQSLGAEVTP